VDEFRVKEGELPERPSWVGPTVFDIVDFPAPLDEIARRSTDSLDLVANLHLIDQNARVLIELEQSLLEQGKSPPKFLLRDVRFSLKLLSELQDATIRKDGYAAIEAALHLGAITERIRTRALYDDHIQRGRRLCASAGKSREKNAVKTEDRRAAIKKRVVDLVKEEAIRPPKERATKREIRELVASEFGVSVRTIMRAEKNSHSG